MIEVFEGFGDGYFEALECAKGLAATPANLERVARGVGEYLSRWAFGQWDLRKRARTKFSLADEMLFDRDGLEMASHEEVARFHASRFPTGSRIVDLTCGIGADLIAFARAGTSMGYELDEVRAAMARHNLAVHGLSAEVRVQDSLALEWDFEFAFADPSRRSGGRRVFDPLDFEPDPGVLADRMGNLRMGMIKLSPMIPDEFLSSFGAETIFLSHAGECKEALLKVGIDFPIAEAHKRMVWAFQAEHDTPLMGEMPTPNAVEEPLRFLYEADPAAIRAHALGDLCGRLPAAPLGDSSGYLTSDSEPMEKAPLHLSWARRYAVCGFGHADPKRIREDLRRLDLQVEAVKVRGVKEEPISWMAKVRTSGKRKVVLVLYPVGKSVRFVLAEPL